jgi:hypothetical protein
MGRIIILVGLLLIGGSVSAKQCTRLDANQADAVLDYLDSWKNVHLAYTQYLRCEVNLGIFEGFSNAVSHLLQNDWARVGELSAIIRSDAHFETFVLRHVDETIEDEDRRRLDEFARDHCVPEAVPFCAKLRARISSLGPWRQGNAT